MRHQGKNSKRLRVFGPLLLLALLPGQASFAVGDSLECQVKEDDLKHTFTREAEHYCPTKDGDDRACWQLLHMMKDLSALLRAAKEKNCQKVVESAQRAQQVSGQLDAIERNLGTYNSLLVQYDEYDKQLKGSIKRVEGALKPVLLPHPQAPKPEPSTITDQRKQIESALKDQKFWDKWTMKGPAEVKDAGNSKNHFAAAHGAEFVQMLRKADKENALDRQKIQSDITQLERNKEAMNKPPGQQQQPPPGTTTTKNPGGGIADGMNMNTLMGLATAGMGLAQMMKQQQAAQDQGMPQATSPTPASQNGPAEKPTPSVSKLEDGKNKGGNKVDAAPATNTDTSTAAGPANVPSGGPFREDSDISAPEKAQPMAPATSKAPGGGGGSPGGGGGESPAQRELSAAAIEQKKEEEAFQGIPGGGLGGGPGGGGGSMPPGAPTDPAVAAAEDGMKDLLNEMKDTVEGNNDGEGAQAADGAAIEMDAEDLFPRVRAAHVRSLKQGRVLNGLGEKITPDSE